MRYDLAGAEQAAGYMEVTWFSFVLLVLAFPVSFYLYYIVGMHAFTERLWGIGQIGHPILGGYVIALAVVWKSLLSKKMVGTPALGFVDVRVSFVAMGQSRGALLALVVGLCAMSLLSVERRYALLICALALGG